MIPLPLIAKPFQRIAMDIVGPLPWSNTSNRYILTINFVITQGVTQRLYPYLIRKL